ncbi:MAG: hypothetical protein ACXABJ_03520 [Candidatus Heimdallarchaeaceae archaeon]|jgi:hypothetical protein
METKKVLAVTLILLFSLLAIPKNAVTITQTEYEAENNEEDFGSSYFTIADLNWTVGQQSRGPTVPLTYLPGSGYSYDINDTMIHLAETTGTFEVNVGAYANIPLISDGIHVEFEARAIGGHIDSIGFEMIIYNNITKEQIYFWDKWRTGTLDSGFLSFEFTYLFNDMDDIVIFLGYGDGHIANWQRECWFRELKIYNDVSKNDLITDNIETVFPSEISLPRGLVWYDDSLWSLVGGGNWKQKRIFQYDPMTGLALNNWSIGIFNPSGLAFDGSHFWISGFGNSTLYKFDTSFNLVDKLTMSVSSIGGLTYDGKNFWVGDHQNDLLYMIDEDTGELLNTIPVPGLGVVGLDFDGTYILLCDSLLNQVYQISPSNGSVVNSYDIPINNSYGITLDNMNNLWITDFIDRLIYKLDIQINADTQPPTIYGSEDITYTVGSLGNFINWTIREPYPNNYSIYRNNALVESDIWELSYETIVLNVDNLVIGEYNYTIIAYDAYGNKAENTIFVTVIPVTTTISLSIVAIIAGFSSVVFIFRKKKEFSPF